MWREYTWLSSSIWPHQRHVGHAVPSSHNPIHTCKWDWLAENKKLFSFKKIPYPLVKHVILILSVQYMYVMSQYVTCTMHTDDIFKIQFQNLLSSFWTFCRNETESPFIAILKLGTTALESAKNLSFDSCVIIDCTRFNNECDKKDRKCMLPGILFHDK